jgi:rod shape determining protein RodA
MGTLITSLGTRRQAYSRAGTLDPYLIVTTLVLIGFGLVTIWSADGGGAIHPSSLVVRQFMFVLVGMPIMIAVTTLDYRYVRSLAWIVYLATVGMLILVTVAGTTIGGSTRWLSVGPILIQPSEFAKLGVIISLAAFVADRGDEMRRLHNFILAGLLVLIPLGLVYQQPDLGTAGVFAFIWLAVMLVSRTRLIYVLGSLAAAPVLGLFAWKFVMHDYMRERLLISFEPQRDYFGAGFNIIQAQITIGSGGWFGHGLSGSSQSQLDLLRVRTTDFIFAHAMGMFGFVGAVALFVTIAILLWRSLHVAVAARDSFGQFVAVGVSAMIFFQAFVNVGMNIGIMPVTGIPLPFVSMGGSSLWTLLAAIGLLQSILIHHRRLGFQRE